MTRYAPSAVRLVVDYSQRVMVPATYLHSCSRVIAGAIQFTGRSRVLALSTPGVEVEPLSGWEAAHKGGSGRSPHMRCGRYRDPCCCAGKRYP